MATTKKSPVVLELAAMPREQVGPFLLLGVDKVANKEQIEANWAQRVIWARKKQIRVPLEDINWAREIANDVEKRIRADAASLNLDTTENVLRKLADRYSGKQVSGARYKPLDVEKALGGYTPPTEIPDVHEVRNSITVPEVPEEVPAVAQLVEGLLRLPMDPWKINLQG
jgi:hypothetical protein